MDGMRPEAAFQLVQLLPLPIWFVWILLPRSRAARYLAGAGWPWAVLACAYLTCFALAIATGGELGPFVHVAVGGDAPVRRAVGRAHGVGALSLLRYVRRAVDGEPAPHGVQAIAGLVRDDDVRPDRVLAFFATRRWLERARPVE